MADEQRYEFTSYGHVVYARKDKSGGLHWSPRLGTVDAIAELLRLAARERELTAQLDERERLGSESLEKTARLTARISDLETGGLALAEDASRMQARLSRLDALLVSEEVPEGLVDQMFKRISDPGEQRAFARLAWLWFREVLLGEQSAEESEAERRWEQSRHGRACDELPHPNHSPSDAHCSCGEAIPFAVAAGCRCVVCFLWRGRHFHPQAAPPVEPQEAVEGPLCESCGKPADGRSLDDIPLCSTCGEGLEAEDRGRPREEWCDCGHLVADHDLRPGGGGRCTGGSDIGGCPCSLSKPEAGEGGGR